VDSSNGQESSRSSPRANQSDGSADLLTLPPFGSRKQPPVLDSLPLSSRSSSASSLSNSVSSNSSFAQPIGHNASSVYCTTSKNSRLEAVNSDKYKEIIQNAGLLNFGDGCVIRTTMDDLEKLCELGSGTCGRVVKMRHKANGRIIAVKVFYNYFLL
jgi:hypothetical protein